MIATYQAYTDAFLAPFDLMEALETNEYKTSSPWVEEGILFIFYFSHLCNFGTQYSITVYFSSENLPATWFHWEWDNWCSFGDEWRHNRDPGTIFRQAARKHDRTVFSSNENIQVWLNYRNENRVKTNLSFSATAILWTLMSTILTRLLFWRPRWNCRMRFCKRSATRQEGGCSARISTG